MSARSLSLRRKLSVAVPHESALKQCQSAIRQPSWPKLHAQSAASRCYIVVGTGNDVVEHSGGLLPSAAEVHAVAPLSAYTGVRCRLPTWLRPGTDEQFTERLRAVECGSGVGRVNMASHRVMASNRDAALSGCVNIVASHPCRSMRDS